MSICHRRQPNADLWLGLGVVQGGQGRGLAQSCDGLQKLSGPSSTDFLVGQTGGVAGVQVFQWGQMKVPEDEQVGEQENGEGGRCPCEEGFGGTAGALRHVLWFMCSAYASALFAEVASVHSVHK